MRDLFPNPDANIRLFSDIPNFFASFLQVGPEVHIRGKCSKSDRKCPICRICEGNEESVKEMKICFTISFTTVSASYGICEGMKEISDIL
jgi:hypothetical protein